MNDPKIALVNRFFSGTGASYDFMVNVATFGIDRLWKRKIVSLIPDNSRLILDLACGTGISTLAIARRYPRCKIIGVELREEYLSVARAKFKRLGVGNVEWVLSRAEDYTSHRPFDCVASSYLAKYAELPRLVRNAKSMLKPSGVLVMHDFTYPPRHLVWLWRCYFVALQKIGGAIYPNWREIFYGLPKLIRESRWVPELQQALHHQGYKDIRLYHLTLHCSAIVTARA